MLSLNIDLDIFIQDLISTKFSFITQNWEKSNIWRIFIKCIKTNKILLTLFNLNTKISFNNPSVINHYPSFSLEIILIISMHLLLKYSLHYTVS